MMSKVARRVIFWVLYGAFVLGLVPSIAVDRIEFEMRPLYSLWLMRLNEGSGILLLVWVITFLRVELLLSRLALSTLAIVVAIDFALVGQVYW